LCCCQISNTFSSEGPGECSLKLDWPTRQKICIAIARGLAFLHEESRLKIVHRDIKATNVLLDKNLNAKISDFRLAKLYEGENTHIKHTNSWDLENVLKEDGYLVELVNPRLGSEFDRKEVMVMINVALLCTNPSSSLRPPMSSVLSMLEGRTVVPEFVSDQSEEANMM
ncbi:probable LRR receptor-like serine/threonine-protein kinase At1g53430, partial [Prosopis cineraria]|uniref:probable LRR receptor-like serine/threonine-protein kinase At1g53430 n=1 Tax=Prosopis cineraria TaxID=364024 RepID=UPI00240FC8D3